MSPISIIDERKLFDKDFKIYGDAENPLFLAKDVAQWIDYSKTGNGHYDVSRMLGTVDEDEKVTKVVRTPGGNQKAFFLTEDGLYEVLMKSRKPIAKVFKKKVKEILRSIRKHGAYMTPKKLAESLLTPDTMIQLLTTLKEEQEKNKDLSVILEEQKPKVIFANSVESSKTTILVGELAKILKQNGVSIGQNRLFAWLRDNGYLISRKGSDYNMPTQYSMERGLFEIKESATNHEDGHTTINKVTKVSGRGQIYFANKFLGEVAV